MIILLLLLSKMAKKIEVNCNFMAKQLVCRLSSGMMDMLKIRTKLGEHTFREDIYTRSLKYRMWSNHQRPF